VGGDKEFRRQLSKGFPGRRSHRPLRSQPGLHFHGAKFFSNREQGNLRVVCVPHPCFSGQALMFPGHGSMPAETGSSTCRIPQSTSSAPVILSLLLRWAILSSSQTFSLILPWSLRRMSSGPLVTPRTAHPSLILMVSMESTTLIRPRWHLISPHFRVMTRISANRTIWIRQRSLEPSMSSVVKRVTAAFARARFETISHAPLMHQKSPPRRM
jgi:hypothetical protein